MAVYTIDTDGVSGDFSSLAAAMAAVGTTIEADLAVAGGHTFLCKATTLVKDTTQVTIGGFINASATNKVVVEGDMAYRNGRPYSSNTYNIVVATPFTELRQLKFRIDDFGISAYCGGIRVDAADVTLKNLDIQQGNGTGLGVRAIYFPVAATNAALLSSLIYTKPKGAAENHASALTLSDASQKVVNCTFVRAECHIPYMTGLLLNNVMVGAVSDISDNLSAASTGNFVGVSAVGELTGSGNTFGVQLDDTLFIKKAIHEYAPAKGSVLIGGGVDASAHLTTDIGGVAYDTLAWDVGCFRAPKFVVVNTDSAVVPDYTSLASAFTGEARDLTLGSVVFDLRSTSNSYYDENPSRVNSNFWVNSSDYRKVYIMGNHEYGILRRNQVARLLEVNITHVLCDLDVVEVKKTGNYDTLNLSGSTGCTSKIHAVTVAGDAEAAVNSNTSAVHLGLYWDPGVRAELSCCQIHSCDKAFNPRAVTILTNSVNMHEFVFVNNTINDIAVGNINGSVSRPFDRVTNGSVYDIRNNVATGVGSIYSYNGTVSNNFTDVSNPPTGWTSMPDRSCYVLEPLHEYHPSETSVLTGAGVNVGEYVTEDAGGVPFDPDAWDVGALATPTFMIIDTDGVSGNYNNIWNAAKGQTYPLAKHIVFTCRNSTGVDDSQSLKKVDYPGETRRYRSFTLLGNRQYRRSDCTFELSEGMLVHGFVFEATGNIGFVTGFRPVKRFSHAASCSSKFTNIGTATSVSGCTVSYYENAFGAKVSNLLSVGFPGYGWKFETYGYFLLNSILLDNTNDMGTSYNRIGYMLDVITSDITSDVNRVIIIDMHKEVVNGPLDYVDRPNGDYRLTNSANNQSLVLGKSAWRQFTKEDILGAVRSAK